MHTTIKRQIRIQKCLWKKQNQTEKDKQEVKDMKSIVEESLKKTCEEYLSRIFEEKVQKNPQGTFGISITV